MGLEVASGVGEWGLGGRGRARGRRFPGFGGNGECQCLTRLLPAPGGAPVSGTPASDPWAPAPAFSDPWGGSPAKPSTNGTAGTGGGLGERGRADPWVCEGSRLLGPGEAECHLDPRIVVGGFDTEADEFSDFDRLRTALPASGSSTGEPPPRLCWAALCALARLCLETSTCLLM